MEMAIVERFPHLLGELGDGNWELGIRNWEIGNRNWGLPPAYCLLRPAYCKPPTVTTIPCRIFVPLRPLSALLYYLILLPVSLLPFPLLYGLSDGLFLLLWYALPYRKRIVLTNIRNSFPEKSDREVRRIARDFYAHLCDLIVESLKTFTASPASIRKRVDLVNPEVLEKY